MASAAMYDHAIEEWMRGNLDWEADTIRAVLVSDDYTPDQAGDSVRADIGSNDTSSPVTVQGRTIETKAGLTRLLSDGSLRWSQFTGEFRYIVLYADRGSSTTDVLVAFSDLGDQEASNAAILIDYPAGVCEFANQAAPVTAPETVED